jgi:hypothetical protein
VYRTLSSSGGSVRAFAGCLAPLIDREDPSWDPTKYNTGGSGAYGLPQGVAGLQDGIGGRRLGDESVHADSLDARLRERSLWLVRRARWLIPTPTAGTKDRSAQPQAKCSAGLQGTVAGFEPPVSSLGAAAEATCRSDISLVAQPRGERPLFIACPRWNVLRSP